MGEWTFRHTVVAAVDPKDAWAFWTDVENWILDASLESVTLDGPFAAGTTGITKPRRAEPLRWQIREAGEGHATIEMPLPGALLVFHWSFEPAEAGATRITQSVYLSGEAVADMMAGAEQLAVGIPQACGSSWKASNDARGARNETRGSGAAPDLLIIEASLPIAKAGTLGVACRTPRQRSCGPAEVAGVEADAQP